MATNILMPALSPTMTEGTLARWLKKEGETITAGDVIAEIETDKATMEVEAVDEGVLGKILVPDGTANVAVNAPIAVLVAEGEAVPGGAANGASQPAEPRAGSADSSPSRPPAANGAAPGGAPAPAEAGSSAAVPASGYGASSAEAAAGSTPAAPVANGHDTGTAGRVFASPLARRIAGEAGIALSGIKGSGPNGRIVRADVEAARKAGPAAAAPAPAMAGAAPAAQPAVAQAPAAQAPGTPVPGIAVPGATPVLRPAPIPVTAPHQVIPNSSMRKVIARRLAESKQFTPHFYVSIDVELDALLKLRAELNARSPKEGPGAFKLSVNDLLIKAVAVTLRRVPKANVTYTDDAILQYDDVDIAVAVSIPDGLITPIIRQADRKGLAAISNEAKDLIARARAGKLKPAEFQGGGFSISNMGMFGVKEFSAIINPPQGGILAVAAGLERAVVKGGQIVVATVMTCTLSVDHRAIDGALAAEWVAAFKAVVEDPLSLML